MITNPKEITVREVLSEAIAEEKQFHDLFERYSHEVSDPKIQMRLAEIAREEEIQVKHITECLEELTMQMETDEAIMESYDHF